MRSALLISSLLFLAITNSASAQYGGWAHSGSVYILTTPEGADLPATASVENFPIIVRLHRDFFDFKKAKPNGEDLRFSTAKGDALAYQIEEWDAKNGTACVWVRVPKITGNTRQEIKLYWGNLDAKSESNGKAVFNKSNDYLSVWHMNDPLKDDVGTVGSKDTGTTNTTGLIGPARRFAGGKGITCGDKIETLPAASASHTTEIWVRPEKPNATLIGWGNEQGQGKVVMQYRSPSHIRMDCYFSDADVTGKTPMPLDQWSHVVHTYEKGDSRIYVNGVLDTSAKTKSTPLNIRTPARLFIGGWYDNYNFVGDIDEVRISKVARSPEWIKLQYENQKPNQTLVGPVVQPGKEFALSEEKVSVLEGKSMVINATAGGAQKVIWSLVRDGKETVVASDRFAYTFEAGRVVGDQVVTLRVKAICPDQVKTKDVVISIREDIPEPEFTLQAPPNWDGRKTIEIVPKVTNLETLRSKGADKLKYAWSISDLATIHETPTGKLILKRAQNSGSMTVSVAIDNGGKPVLKSVPITVKQPAQDDWVIRTPAKDEKPEEGQFYARDDKNEGALHYNGSLNQDADEVFLKVFADDKPYQNLSQKPKADKAYTFAVKLKPGLVKYRVEFGTKTAGVETVLNKVSNLVCGDAYIIEGQSNAVATDIGKDDPVYRSDWIRTYGSMSANPKNAKVWGNAIHRSREDGKFQIGYWGMELGRRIVETHKIPVCFINGAVGGTRIDQHQRNPLDPEDLTTIYGRLLWRIQQAKLTHGIRGVLWHQGENDQGADGPTGGYGYENYRQLFIDMTASWKTDFPNIQHYYVFQIWPKACAMGINGSDNRLREVQRNLPSAFSNLSVMSTLGIDPPGGCHFPPAGYAEFARLICPLLERDHYGKKPTTSIMPPNLKRVYRVGEKGDEIVLEFDQPVKWDNTLTGEFYFDGQKDTVASGIVEGVNVKLKLKAGFDAKTITYLDSASWSQKRLLIGENGIAALTFCEVPVAPTRGK